ncbi:TetR/AcrR family transcriptional regulator [Ruegeria marina]|uniref:Transcriptional regulator, TetR family n=1 Tax=Ruegeria marina TaxID=639004 RepID=A0A1G6UL58_9RHOB|nr:TetR/AcrR family transcriptional regulator [Ruegeria marina]SDD42019.1 transcriptional regulator, TetR family [Ruegeria marina]
MATERTANQIKDGIDREDLPGYVKVTRDDWLRVAMDLLVSDGVSEVKVLTIGNRLGVSRSSFYWYFKSHKDLLDQLLHEWERTNTGILVRAAQTPAPTITAALNNFFRCIVDPNGFNHPLDFAVREWARRDGGVRRVIDRSDEIRTSALMKMFEAHGYDPSEADIRARVLYYQQIGYYALDLKETLEERLSRAALYLYAFTGVHPLPEEVEDFKVFARQVASQ